MLEEEDREHCNPKKDRSAREEKEEEIKDASFTCNK
jgi:hypothetical protein